VAFTATFLYVVCQGREKRSCEDWDFSILFFTALINKNHAHSDHDLLFETADMQYEGIMNPDMAVRDTQAKDFTRPARQRQSQIGILHVGDQIPPLSFEYVLAQNVSMRNSVNLQDVCRVSGTIQVGST